MHQRKLSFLPLSLLSLSLLAVSPANADETRHLEEARGVAATIPPKLLKVLQDEIQKAGPEAAISVCREKAPQMAKDLSEKTGWQIRRVSLKNRNPKAAPDAWEQEVLNDFDARAKAGEKPATLERGEVVSVGNEKTYRYMKALPTNELCLGCHGAAEQMTPGIRAKLQALYPEDKATGYTVGQIRGALTLKRPL